MTSFVVSAKDLKAIAHMAVSIGKKSYLPIAKEYVLTSASAGRLNLYSTNLETSISMSIDVEEFNGEKIEACVNWEMMLKFINAAASLPGGLFEPKITVRFNMGEVELVAGSATMSTPYLEPHEFPERMKDDDEKAFCASVDLACLSKNFLPHACTDDLRPVMKNVWLDGQRGAIVATDAHTMCIADAEVSESLLLPRAFINDFGRMVEGRVDVFIVGNSVMSSWEDDNMQVSVWCVKMTQNEFHDWTVVIPKEFKATVTVRREELLAAMSILPREKTRDGYVFANIVMSKDEDGRLRIDSRQDSMAPADVHMTLPAFVDGDLEATTFNVVKVEKALKSIEDEEVIVRFTSKSTAAMFYEKNGNKRMLVMSVNFENV